MKLAAQTKTLPESLNRPTRFPYSPCHHFIFGGEANGYGLYVLKGKPVFTYNLLDTERTRWEAPQTLAPGKHTVIFDFTYDGLGIAKGGTGVLKVDGQAVDTKAVPRTIPFTMPFGETFDVGVDRARA